MTLELYDHVLVKKEVWVKSPFKGFKWEPKKIVDMNNLQALLDGHAYWWNKDDLIPVIVHKYEITHWKAEDGTELATLKVNGKKSDHFPKIDVYDELVETAPIGMGNVSYGWLIVPDSRRVTITMSRR